MQNITMYVSVAQTLGTVKDYAGNQGVDAPTLVLGAKASLKMRLFAEPDGYAPYPFAELSDITSWEFVLDTDYDSTTNAKIVANNANIIARQVQHTISGEERTETELYVPISSMATTELVTALGDNETLKLNGELCGYDSAGELAFILQIIGFTVRNRITSPGATTPTTPTYLTATETRALVNAVDIKLGGAQLAETFNIASADTFPTCRQIADYVAQCLANVTLNEITPKSIELSGATTVSGSTQLSANVLPTGANQTVAWSSDNTNIATVDNGLVTVVASGACSITATSTRNPAVSASININCSL